MSRSKSSNRWLQEHFNDPYVKMAQAQGYRARSVFKLLEIQEKDQFIRPGMTIIELGAAPGSWSQVISKATGKHGRLIALDRLPMESLPGVEVIEGDFREETVYHDLLKSLNGVPVDLVISDMAPNISGNKAMDQPAAMYLADLALEFAQKVLRPGGGCLIKLFQGAGFEAFVSRLRKRFNRVVMRKPKASRPRSNEVYCLATGFIYSNVGDCTIAQE